MITELNNPEMRDINGGWVSAAWEILKWAGGWLAGGASYDLVMHNSATMDSIDAGREDAKRYWGKVE